MCIDRGDGCGGDGGYVGRSIAAGGSGAAQFVVIRVLLVVVFVVRGWLWLTPGLGWMTVDGGGWACGTPGGVCRPDGRIHDESSMAA